MEPTPMFPLGTVLFPHTVLPLHVFEPRYRAMLRDVLDGDGRFGVCLIERGSEVGGADVRTGLGTIATVVRANELPDGRWQVVALGSERIVVDEWLADDPYPRATVQRHPDPPCDAEETSSLPAVAARLDDIRRRIAARQGRTAEPIELPDDPTVASYHLAASAPVSELDRQRLLGASTVGLRLQLLDVLLVDLDATLRAMESQEPER